MKVVILAGGFGTRLSEYTDSMPKPMVTIGGKPILWHIMKNYAKFGHTDFNIALGYKAEIIKEYFLNYSVLNSDFTVDLGAGVVKYFPIFRTCAFNMPRIDEAPTLSSVSFSSSVGGRLSLKSTFIEK